MKPLPWLIFKKFTKIILVRLLILLYDIGGYLKFLKNRFFKHFCALYSTKTDQKENY